MLGISNLADFRPMGYKLSSIIIQMLFHKISVPILYSMSKQGVTVSFYEKRVKYLSNKENEHKLHKEYT